MAINKNEVRNLVLSKGVDWFYEFIDDLTPDDAVEVIYEDNYRWQERDNALVVNVKWRAGRI